MCVGATVKEQPLRTKFQFVREHLVAQVVDDLLELARLGLLLDNVGLDLLDFRALVVLELGHLALDPLDVRRCLLVLALGVFDLGLQLDDGRFELLDFADDLRDRRGQRLTREGSMARTEDVLG